MAKSIVSTPTSPVNSKEASRIGDSLMDAYYAAVDAALDAESQQSALEARFDAEVRRCFA